MDYDPDEYEDDDQASEFMDAVRSGGIEVANVYDFITVPFRLMQALFLALQAAFGDIADLIMTKSTAHDMKKQFEREAVRAIEQITGD